MRVLPHVRTCIVRYDVPQHNPNVMSCGHSAELVAGRTPINEESFNLENNKKGSRGNK